jgi:hypothetical protein
MPPPCRVLVAAILPLTTPICRPQPWLQAFWGICPGCSKARAATWEHERATTVPTLAMNQPSLSPLVLRGRKGAPAPPPVSSIRSSWLEEDLAPTQAPNPSPPILPIQGGIAHPLSAHQGGGINENRHGPGLDRPPQRPLILEWGYFRVCQCWINVALPAIEWAGQHC